MARGTVFSIVSLMENTPFAVGENAPALAKEYVGLAKTLLSGHMLGHAACKRACGCNSTSFLVLQRQRQFSTQRENSGSKMLRGFSRSMKLVIKRDGDSAICFFDF